MSIPVSSNHAQGEVFFLNLRFLLILSVFVGNAIEPLIWRMDSMYSLYQWIFTFHMPLFVFVTGYFAKNNLKGTPGRKVMLQIGLQYMIFQSLYSMLDMLWFQVDSVHRSFFAPYLLLWFLASHLGWRTFMLLTRQWTPGRQLALSVVLAVLVGYLPIDGVWLSISRTFVFLPFFVLGYHFSDQLLAYLQKPKVRIAAASASLVWLLVLGLGLLHIAPGWLYGSLTYKELGSAAWMTGLFRLLLYPVQLLAGLAFLGLVPVRSGRITEWGRRTLYVFLLHGFVVRFAALSPIYEHIHNLAGALLLILATTALTILLTHPLVRRCTAPLIEPPTGWLLAPRRHTLNQPRTASKS